MNCGPLQHYARLWRPLYVECFYCKQKSIISSLLPLKLFLHTIYGSLNAVENHLKHETMYTAPDLVDMATASRALNLFMMMNESCCHRA